MPLPQSDECMRQRANRHGEPSQNVPENCLTVNLTNTDKPDQQDGFVSKDSCQPNSLSSIPGTHTVEDPTPRSPLTSTMLTPHPLSQEINV